MWKHDRKIKSMPILWWRSKNTGGNLRSESYLEDPYSGVGYVIIHDISNSTDCCPIATNLDEIQGRYIYTSKQEAIDAWKKELSEDMLKNI